MQRRLVRRGLAPAAALAGAALGSDAVAAALGAPLVASTVRTATLASFAGLKTGSITTEVAALVRAAVRAMLLGRIAKVSAFLLIFMVGASAVATQILGPEWPAGHRRSDGKQPPVPTPANFERPAPRLDRFGHPLPPGVVTRLGTTQRRHTARVVSVGFSIDGAAAITCQVDGLVRFWDAENGSQRELIDLTSGTYGDHLSIRQVAMSRDGRYLAAAGFLRNAAAGNRGDRVWILSLPAVRVVGTIPTRTIDLQCLAFSPDGTTIATGAFAGEVKLWEVATGECQKTTKLVENQSVFSLSFSPEGKIVATNQQGKGIKLWKPWESGETTALELPSRGRGCQNAAVQMLSQIDGPAASNGLAVLAVFSSVPEIRSRATEALERRDTRDFIGRLIATVHKPYKYEVHRSQSPGPPGQLFFQGERFTASWFYNNLLADVDLAASAGMGRFYTSAMPFNPFSLQNTVAAALGAEYDRLQHFTGVLPVGGFRDAFPIPLSPQIAPQSASAAGHAIAANPQNSAAILNQLTSNPANQTLPPLFWFVLANQHVPSNPTQAAMVLLRRDQAAISPANAGANMVLAVMIQAQGTAAQQDMTIAHDLLAAQQAKLNLQQKLAMDIQMIEAVNAGITTSNARVLPVLTAITGQDFGAEPTDGKSGGWRSSVRVRALRAWRRVRWFAPSKARPIESITAGDRVLAQDTTSGKLTFQAVVATRAKCPPAPSRSGPAASPSW